MWFTSADGTRLHGWLFEHPEPQHVVLYCHGNGEHVAYNADLMNHLRHVLDATVLVFDYRGYGKSEGRPHEAGVVADGKAAHRWLAERSGIASEQIVLMGRSLGGGVAAASAADIGAKALVLQSTFARMVDTAAELYPWLPVRLVMRNRYDSVAHIQQYNGPVLQSHGTADETVSYHQAQKLFEAVRSPLKQWIKVPGGAAQFASAAGVLRAAAEVPGVDPQSWLSRRRQTVGCPTKAASPGMLWQATTAPRTNTTERIADQWVPVCRKRQKPPTLPDRQRSLGKLGYGVALRCADRRFRQLGPAPCVRPPAPGSA